MKHAAIVVVFLALAFTTTTDAAAHEIPARRSVQIQAEPDALVLLVTWTAPSGPMAPALTAHTAWRRAGSSVAPALEGALAAAALGPIRVRADDGDLREVNPLGSELVVDPSTGSPAGVAVLVEVPLDRPQRASVEFSPRGATRILWRERGEVTVQSSSHPRPGIWYRHAGLLTLTWSQP